MLGQKKKKKKKSKENYMGSISSLMHISLNNIDTFCQHFCICPFGNWKGYMLKYVDKNVYCTMKHTYM